MADLAAFLRYPGSKRRMLHFLAAHLPQANEIKGNFIEPFVGGGAIYFYLQPKKAILGDLNRELIDIYKGVSHSPQRVWSLYRDFPGTKTAYRKIRETNTNELTLLQRAARSLFLSRTCFKGMWRHNRSGKFNIGYGGQSRRWSISRKDLLCVATLLRRANLVCSDFEPIISSARKGDYLVADPPYRPGEREQIHDHYGAQQFRFADHKRLASCLRDADKRGVEWLLTISSHPDIVKLYRGYAKFSITQGTGREIGSRNNDSGEVLLTNSVRPAK